MTLTQQWWYLNLTGNRFYILFPAKCIMTYRQIISSWIYVCSKGTCSLASRAILNTVNKPNNVIWIIWKSQKATGATSSLHVWLCCKVWFQLKLTLWEPGYDISILWNRRKTSSCQVPYQHPSSSANCARELFKGSNEWLH